MSIFKQLQALLRGQAGPVRRERMEPRLPEHLYMIPDRGPAPQPEPEKSSG